MKKLRWQIAQFFEKKWWINYLKKKDSTEYIVWKINYWKDFLNKLNFNINNQQKILDVGCGPAGTFILAKEMNNKWIALDPLLDSYETLGLYNEKVYPNVKFVTKSFESFDTIENFDTIFCVNAINHFQNINKNLVKLNSLLKQKSSLILSVDAHNYRILKWILYYLPLDILHPHQYTEKEYEKMFLKNGFNIQKKELFKKEFIFSYYVYVLSK